MQLSTRTLLLCLATIVQTTQLPRTPRLQAPLTEDTEQTSSPGTVYNLAIIGAGIAGSVAAFEARDAWDRWSHRTLLNITVFEAATRTGGRVKSVIQFDGRYDEAHSAEAGAKWVHEDDRCMLDIIDRVGLRRDLRQSVGSSSDVGVWDGNKLRVRKDSQMRPRTWRHKLELALEYGRQVYIVQNWITSGLACLSRFWELLRYPVGTLAGNLRRAGADDFIRDSASQVVADGISSSRYAREMLEPLLRSRHSLDMGSASQLALLDALSSSGSICFHGVVFDTMQSVVDRLLLLAKTDLKLRHQVRRIELVDDNKYSLAIESDGSAPTNHGPFDGVIIATPLSTAAIDVLGALPETTDRQYEKRHVTLFASVLDLSPTYFNLSSTERVPDTIYTNHFGHELPFLSIERTLTDKGFYGDEVDSAYLYRFTSSETLPDEVILALLGQSHASSLEDAQIEWTHRQTWPNGARVLSKTEPLESTKLAHGLYYTGAADDVLMSLESSCQFGRLAARMANYYARCGDEGCDIYP